MYIGGFCLPMAIIILCYIFILKAIRKHDKEMQQMARKMKMEDIRANQEKTKAEIKIAKIAMMIVCLFVLSWGPYATVALIGQFQGTFLLSASLNLG
jgi:r-opsin